MSDQDLKDLCKSIEESFEVKKVKTTKNCSKFQLARHISRMKWVDGGKIKIQLKSDQQYQIEYSLYFYESLIYYGAIFSLFSLITIGSSVAVITKIIVPFGLFLLLIGLCKLAFFFFEMKVNNIINNITLLNVELSSKQKEWVENPDTCPACGQLRISQMATCPDCGIALG